jgi:galactan endo-beta-1,3-galactanase
VTSGGQTIQLHYRSGTIFAKPTFAVAAGGGFDISASFIAPTTKGTWPAFWLTAVSGWPPEIDIAEWKGNGDISFNTFNTSSIVTAHNVPYPNSGSVHTVKAELRAESDGRTVKVNFYLDGTLQMTQFADEYVGKAMWL